MRVNNQAKWALSLAALLSSTAMCANTKAGAPAHLDQLKQDIEARYPDAKVIDVKPSPVGGLYEVYTGDSIAYVDATGNYMFVGSMMDTRSKMDLTSESLGMRNRIDFSSLPFDRAIKIVKGNGQRQIALFSDPDCPFCQALEKELAAITNVTIYTFLYPLKDLHPDAVAHSKAIWCAEDRPEAWSQWMMQKKEPKAGAACDGDPVEEMLTLGKEFRITGTPTMYLANGRRIDGTMPAAQLEDLLNATKAKDAARPVAAAR